jgi:hypothetical protein
MGQLHFVLSQPLPGDRFKRIGVLVHCLKAFGLSTVGRVDPLLDELPSLFAGYPRFRQ